MPTIHFVSKNAAGEIVTQSVSGQPGQTVMQAAVGAGIEGIAADCGGLLTCATCHVYVAEPWVAQLPAPDEDEHSMLDFAASPRQSGSRLSCQIHLTEALDGLTVELPPTQY